MNNDQLEINKFDYQFNKFPGSRFMGSKNKIIYEIWNVLKNYDFKTFFDAFGGSNVVGYFMKTRGKQVISNDFMEISFVTSKAIIENTNIILEDPEIDFLLNNLNNESFISKTFKDLYFDKEDNKFLDQVRYNISLLKNEYKKSISLAALVRSCIKKRPRGIFTFVGNRYDDGRKDIKKSLRQHFLDNIILFNNAVFNNNTKCKSYNSQIQEIHINTDLVYLDPPYFTPNSDNDYVRRYHFVEGLVKNWKGLEIQKNTKTKKFKSYNTPFSQKENAYLAFEVLIKRYRNSIIAISYSSNSKPTKDEMIEIISKYKKKVSVYEIDHVYSFGNQGHIIGNNNNRVKEYLFIGVS